MISYSVVIILFLVECCPANKRVGPHYEPTSSPRGNGRKSTHISEFTDPATGLNPFLDLEEGRAGDMGRNIVEEEGGEVLPQPLPDSDPQLLEGGPDDRDRPRWNDGFGRRWGNFNNKAPQHVIPVSLVSDVTSTERQGGNSKYGSFFTSTEANFQMSPGVFVPSTKNSDMPDYHSLTPVEDQSSDMDYNPEYHEVEAETAVIREDSVHPKKIPVSKNVLISAAITGASVAVVALLLAICWWRQKMKRVSTRGNVSITDNNMESIISEKSNRNSGIQKKSVSA